MDAVRRGYLGLALFIAALVLMPLLVVDYHGQTEARASKAAAGDGSALAAQPTGTAGAPPPTTAPPTPRIVRFLGVAENEVLRGRVRITLETTGDVGSVVYRLLGIGGQWPAPTAPYLFAVHGDDWDTSAVPNGRYTLTATPLDASIPSATVHFSLAN